MDCELPDPGFLCTGEDKTHKDVGEAAKEMPEIVTINGKEYFRRYLGEDLF